MQRLFDNIGLNLYDNPISLAEGEINIIFAGKPVTFFRCDQDLQRSRLICNVYL